MAACVSNGLPQNFGVVRIKRNKLPTIPVGLELRIKFLQDVGLFLRQFVSPVTLILVMAASEVSVGRALLLLYRRRFQSIDVDRARTLRG